MAKIRDSLCNLNPVEIPRPHIAGLQFIPTRGRLGFYKSIRCEGTKFGVEMKPIGPRRPKLSDACWSQTECENGNEQSNESKASDDNCPTVPENDIKQNETSKDEAGQNQLQSVATEQSQSPSLELPCPEPDYENQPDERLNV